MEDKQQLDKKYHYIMETFVERGNSKFTILTAKGFKKVPSALSQNLGTAFDQ